MSDSSRKHLKKLVAVRAGGRCEYCRVLEYLSNFEFHLEHIISLQHSGSTSPENLAYSCSWCNWKKGPNIATILKPGGELTPLFNPRTQNWFSHFQVDSNGLLLDKSDVGKATIKLLNLNHPDRIKERFEMMKGGFYP